MLGKSQLVCRQYIYIGELSIIFNEVFELRRLFLLEILRIIFQTVLVLGDELSLIFIILSTDLFS